MTTILSNEIRISVLMPVFNGAKHLRGAIESILCQTEKNFEFLIIDDGSSDSTAEIVGSYRDSRIRFVKNTSNQGLVSALNQGIELSVGEFVARMDADDLSVPKRLEFQLDFMRTHPSIGICGGKMLIFGMFPSEIWAPPTEPDEIRSTLFLKNALAHSSVMIRKSLLNKFQLRYNNEFRHCEDWWLWWRSSHYFPIANSPEILILYRRHKDSISSLNGLAQQDAEQKLLERIASDLRWPSLSGISSLSSFESNLAKIWRLNETSRVFKSASFKNVLSAEWLKACIGFANLGLSTWRQWRLSNFRNSSSSFLVQVKFFLICLFRWKPSGKNFLLRLSRFRPRAEILHIFLRHKIRITCKRLHPT